MSAKQRCIHRSKTCLTLKHFDHVFATGGNNIVEVFESLTTSTFKRNKMASNFEVHSPPEFYDRVSAFPIGG